MLPEAGSQVAREVDSILLAIVYFEIFILAGITATIVWFLVRYRRSAVTRTRQIHGHLGLETAWTVIPTLIVLAMFFIGYKGFVLLRNPPPNALDVRVYAQRWYWLFEYPDWNLSAPELYLPRGRPAKLTITSATDEVLHSFYVPAFRTKEDAVPGMETYVWFQPDRLGTYNIFCAEFCGREHSQMLSKLHVLEPEDFQKWVENELRGRYEPVAAAEALDGDMEELTGQDGDKLFQKYCSACHGAEGKGGGPYGARNFHSLEGWKRGTKLSDILVTITEGIPGTPMRPFRHLPVRERIALLHHVASLATGPRPAVTPEDVQRLAGRYPDLNPETGSRVLTQPSIPLEEAMRQVVEEGGAKP